MFNPYEEILKESVPGNPMKAILTMEAEAWELGRQETLKEVQEVIGDCPDCSKEAMILVINKLHSLK